MDSVVWVALEVLHEIVVDCPPPPVHATELGDAVRVIWGPVSGGGPSVAGGASVPPPLEDEGSVELKVEIEVEAEEEVEAEDEVLEPPLAPLESSSPPSARIVIRPPRSTSTRTPATIIQTLRRSPSSSSGMTSSSGMIHDLSAFGSYQYQY